MATYAVHPLGPCRAEEELGDRLDTECRAHATTREELARAETHLKQFEPLLAAVQAVCAVLDEPTTVAQQDEHLRRLGGPLLQLRAAQAARTPLPEASAPGSHPQSADEVSHG